MATRPQHDYSGALGLSIKDRNGYLNGLEKESSGMLAGSGFLALAMRLRWPRTSRSV